MSKRLTHDKIKICSCKKLQFHLDSINFAINIIALKNNFLSVYYIVS